jgi:hypothetical protein
VGNFPKGHGPRKKDARQGGCLALELRPRHAQPYFGGGEGTAHIEQRMTVWLAAVHLRDEKVALCAESLPM